MPNLTLPQVAALIDHTILKPETTMDQVKQLCREAIDYEFASVCVNPVFVSFAARLLEGSTVKPCSVVGFPLGATTTHAKAQETREAIRFGAREIDMVIWVGGVKANRWDWVEEDIAELANVCRNEGALLKVIFECCLLTDEEKRKACEICVRAGAQYVKTSTGFSTGGATVEDVALMSGIVKPHGLGVKASGGIRSYAELRRMVDAGATRIGTSSGVKILEEFRIGEL